MPRRRRNKKVKRYHRSFYSRGMKIKKTLGILLLAAVVLALAGSLAGWTLTGVGVRYFGLKERTTIRWEKR